jgi:cell wall-associated NlpC family hydrolase
MRARALLAILPVLLLAACGGSSSSTHQIAQWTIEAPAFAPPDPGSPAPTRTTASAPVRRPARPVAQAPAIADTGAPSDAQVRAELKAAFGETGARAIDSAGLTAGGLATVPPAAPNKLASIIEAGNEVARKPYVYGGGHGRVKGEIFTDSAYDCSGSVSYALAAAGFIDSPMTSGALASWGKPGPGKWVTIFANGGHAWMVVAGLRFDTSGRVGKYGSRWQTATRSTAGFTVRHPPGL